MRFHTLALKSGRTGCHSLWAKVSAAWVRQAPQGTAAHFAQMASSGPTSPRQVTEPMRPAVLIEFRDRYLLAARASPIRRLPSTWGLSACLLNAGSGGTWQVGSSGRKVAWDVELWPQSWCVA